MDAISAAIVTKALDALGLRMTATAANIAQGSSPGYRPQRVRLERSSAPPRRGVRARSTR
ncbi:hypothetical protein AB5I41_22695 [Sphingomonas sp. MMS24-JH45]